MTIAARRSIVGRLTAVALALVSASATRLGAQTPEAGVPHLRPQGTARQLVVDGNPFLVLGGELGNSTAATAAALQPVWSTLKGLGLNTVLAPAYWELVEPTEGAFDFSSVDSVIAGARANGMHVVLLWFGSWKNSMSSYAPAYVRTSQARFPRTEATRGRGQEILAPYVAASWQADARAFAALMRHVRTVDGTRHTVLMVQVENEVGMLPEARDHSALADSLFAGPVPRELTSYLTRHRETLGPELRAKWGTYGNRTDGTWAQVFGADIYTDELFMAWHFARYTERVAAAGKAEYPLPMFANAALIRPGFLPGRYVSAGPLPHLLDVWRAGAPSLDLLVPDVYFPNFTEWTGKYARPGNQLFVPEAALNPQAAMNALYAIGRHDAIGFSPFAIESTSNPGSAPVAAAYDVLAQLTPLILAHQGRGTMTAVMPPVAFDGTIDYTPQRVSLGGVPYALEVAFLSPARQAAPAEAIGAGQPGGVPVVFGAPAAGAPGTTTPRGALIIALGPDELLVAGNGVTVTFTPTGPGDPVAGILTADDGRYVDGRWVTRMRLNGDQTNQGRNLRLEADRFTIQRVRLYRYR